MKNLSSSQIRQMFLDYFKSKGHMVEQGHSLIPHDDPTLLWINSGVAALKKYFDGSIKPSSNRITNAQKSIRTNDIENVGKTARHHTFFEMLGNFSIGDYFKQEAIEFAWEFLTSPQWMGLDKDKMYVSVHTDDAQALEIWTKTIGLDEKRILKSDENYWQIGEGPSGPNSEIFFDRGPKYDPNGVGERLFFEELENDRYIEIWNIVFSQYDAKDGVDRKDFKELPQKNIDTGMGLERLVSVIQDGETNFDTDLFMPIIEKTQSMAKIPYTENQVAYRVIADHIRTVTFALGDGALFSNEGRGYVLRRIIRRAIRFGIQIGIEGSFMYKLVDVVADIMKSYYPELLDSKDLVSKLVKIEEERFHLTLSGGEKMLHDILENNQTVSGQDAFKLYDTYGFPLEMTIEIAEEQGISVDVDGFNAFMAKQKEMSRNARVDSESMGSQHEDLMNFMKESEFVGYSVDEVEATVIGLFYEGEEVESLTTQGEVIFDQTVFYAESGGQVADTGVVTGSDFEARVKNVKKAPNKQHLHTIELKEGTVSVGDRVNLKIDSKRRALIRRNHSSVHLLQAALKEILGDHIHQAGSFVSDEYSRFDFSHFEKIDHDVLQQVENRVNDWIFESKEVITEVMNIESAKKSGAIALFDEKYDENVRVVSMGDVSKEFCGGTHVNNTGIIGVFKIVSEESIGSGTRRIVAKTSQGAYETFKSHESHLARIAQEVMAPSTSRIDEKITQLKNERDSLQEQLNHLNQMLINSNVSELESLLHDDALIFKTKINAKNSKQIVETIASKHPNALIFGAFMDTDKVSFVCAVGSKWLNQGLKAGELVKEAAKLTNGGGGGRPDFAQAGGKDVTKVDLVLENIQAKLLD